MKYYYTLILFTISFFKSYSATWYSQGSLSASTLSSWNSVRVGGGTEPANFTTTGDVFVIQAGHAMNSGTWNLGPGSLTVRIETNGQLTATGAITFAGQFEIQDGGIYIHNTNSPTTIFSGTENFSEDSKVEINDWEDAGTPFPSGINFGNLSINIGRNLGGNWSLAGQLKNVAGNLSILGSGTGGQSIIFTDNQNLDLLIGKSFTINGANIILKSLSSSNTYSRIDVNENLSVTNGTLDLGTVDFIGNNELRFKGNLQVATNGEIISESDFAFLVVNGTAIQNLNVPSELDASMKVAESATARITRDLSFAPGKYVVVAGNLNAGSFTLGIPSGQLVVAGGNVLSNGTIELLNSNCTVCTGDGNNVVIDWCKASGNKGNLSLNQGLILFSNSQASVLNIGQLSSPGDLSIVSGTVSFTGDPGGLPPGNGIIELAAGSFLLIDENSLVDGDAFYNGNGGKLIIGSLEGITLSGPTGSLQVSGSRNYNNQGDNSFEYRSSNFQESGDGLPAEISGDLIVNNLGGLEVFINNPVQVNSPGKLVLTKGYFTTVGTNDITLGNGVTVTGGSVNSFVNGRLKKIGNTNFTFPVGKAGIYSPVQLNNNSGQDITDKYYVEYFPADPNSTISGIPLPPLALISTVEYWEIEQEAGAGSKSIVLNFTSRSGVQNPGSLVAAYYDGTGYWQNYGNTGTTGTPPTGTLSFDTDFFGYFTFGSLDEQNTLPVNIVSFKASKLGNTTKLDWKINRDHDVLNFEILTSDNNRDFKNIGQVNAASGVFSYDFSDNDSRKGAAYYRLKITTKGGKVMYSKVVVVFHENNGQRLITLAPTVTSNYSNLVINSANAGRISVGVSNMLGQVFQSQ
ncbi:MAG: hypothetical protein ACXWV4_13020, partial [Flavitalea sp.]